MLHFISAMLTLIAVQRFYGLRGAESHYHPYSLFIVISSLQLWTGKNGKCEAYAGFGKSLTHQTIMGKKWQKWQWLLWRLQQLLQYKNKTKPSFWWNIANLRTCGSKSPEPRDGLLLENKTSGSEPGDVTSNTGLWSIEKACTAVCLRFINYESVAFSIRARVSPKGHSPVALI